MMAAAIVGWPLSLWLTDEPPVVLSLSWLALIYTAFDCINTTAIRQKDD